MGALAYRANATFLPLLFGKKIKECLVAVVCSLKFTLLLKLVLSLFSSHSYSSSLCRAVLLSVVFFFLSGTFLLSVARSPSPSYLFPLSPTFFLSVLLFSSWSCFFPLLYSYFFPLSRNFILSAALFLLSVTFILPALLFFFSVVLLSSQSHFHPPRPTFFFSVVALPAVLFFWSSNMMKWGHRKTTILSKTFAYNYTLICYQNSQSNSYASCHYCNCVIP